MRLIDADRMATDELAAFISAQWKITDEAKRVINSIVHEKIQRLIADTPTVEDAVLVVRCKDCIHFEDATVNKKGFVICPNTGMDIWDECYCAHGEKRTAEPQLDGMQFRTVDDLGRICLPKGRLCWPNSMPRCRSGTVIPNRMKPRRRFAEHGKENRNGYAVIPA